jgi:hypothetical protein
LILAASFPGPLMTACASSWMRQNDFSSPRNLTMRPPGAFHPSHQEIGYCISSWHRQLFRSRLL